MSEIQVCEGVFRQKCGRYVAVISCEPREGGQRWTDGVLFYADDGTVTFYEGGCAVDLVEYIGPFPQPDQTAEIARLRTELEQSQGVRRTLAAEIERLQTELRGYAAETHRQLRTLQESHNKATATLQAEQRGEREGFRIAIGMILEALK